MRKNYDRQIVDLTHKLTPDIPTWTGSCGFELILKQDYHQAKTTPGFRVQQMKMHGSAGTHMDAPCHCVPNGKSIADIAPSDLIVPCVMIDVSSAVKGGEYMFSMVELQDFEKIYKPNWKKAFVIIHTGWSRYWTEPAKYINQYVFPSISGEVVEYLVSAGISGIGIDTVSPDKPRDGFPVHVSVLGAGKYIIENIVNANLIPAVGGTAIVAPLKAQDAAESPVRLLALLP